MFDVTVLYNKSNPFGIARDADGIVRALGGTGCTIHRRDPLEPPVPTDLAIHLEIPIYGWMPWAAQNILVVNPEWFEEGWVPYLSRFERVVFKDGDAAARFTQKGWVKAEQVRIVPWGAEAPPAAAAPAKGGKAVPTGNVNTGFIWFLGGSKNKRAAVAPLVRLWRPEYPPLRIYTTEALDLSGTELPENVRVEVKDLPEEQRVGLGRFFRGHICCSRAEGFGYTAAEAEWVGAFTILNALPVYKQDYAGSPGAHFLSSLEGEEAAAELAAAIAAFEAADLDALAAQRTKAAKARWEHFRDTFQGVAGAVTRVPGIKKTKHLPPILRAEDCPRISVVTLLYNRRKFFDLACHNIMITDHPKDKIEWIIVEDSDDPMEDASDRVMAVAAAAEPVKVVYVPLKKKTPVGRKRNIGCEKATGDVILMMDDDDHYPETSFRRRVAWLTLHSWKPKAVAATTIACYDLVKGVSAVNVPPLELPLSQRISEATLTFYRSFWEGGRRFPEDVQVGEGESFIGGAVAEVLEIPPQQIIVAFSHGRNVSSRRIPGGEDLKPGCFWGFPREFLEFIHGLAGVKVVADKAA